MTLLDKLKEHLPGKHYRKDINPVKAYNLWSRNYDAQPDNLMLALETEVFTNLLQDGILKNKVIVDIGCGTGRHWKKILSQSPAALSGYDVSLGMLSRLKEKYPNAIAHQLHDYHLPRLENESCDVIISTLTIAHIRNIEEAFAEWYRVLKPGGEIIITDYHPEALVNGGDRTFVHRNKLIAIKNYVHSFEKILSIILPLDLQVIHWNDRIIDDSVKHYYEEKNAVHVFEKFKGVPIVYGAHLKKEMILRNLHPVSDNSKLDLHIKNGRISAKGDLANINDPHEFIFENVLVFPGLINSHDHLDFNLFPQLRNKLYDNYIEWSNDIHAQNKQIINDVLKVPLPLRVKWGMYKNLINGITTVVNHGARLHIDDDLITVFQQCHNLHSVHLEKWWRYKLNRPFIKKWPYVIHIGEGCDDNSYKEIDTLTKWNLWNRSIVGVHGIAMSERQAGAFKALVWCPSSNHFLIGKTAPIDRLKHATDIIFGTDSTVSASWNLWEHLRLARSTNNVSDAELYAMLTTQPAAVWKMGRRGKIKEEYSAHIVIARQKNNLQGYNAYYALDPEDILMVMRKGEIKLFDEILLKQVIANGISLSSYSKIYIGDAAKYVYGDLPALMAEIKNYYPNAVFPVRSEQENDEKER